MPALPFAVYSLLDNNVDLVMPVTAVSERRPFLFLPLCLDAFLRRNQDRSLDGVVTDFISHSLTGSV